MHCLCCRTFLCYIYFSAAHFYISGCGGNLTGSYGSFASPGYPSGYPANTTCRWLITAPPRLIVRLIFINLNLETDENCLNDYVALYDGLSSQIGRYCGTVSLVFNYNNKY